METFYDWITVAAFAGLIVLFLHRSADEQTTRDSVWQYLIASTGLGVVNWLGNDNHHLLAILLLAVTAAYVHVVLRPLRPPLH